jgi:hypothetical protein
MLEIMGLLVILQLSIILIFLHRFSNRIEKFVSYVEELVDTKLKTKWEMIDEMPVKEAKKWDIRIRSELQQWIDYAAVSIANKVGKMLGGKNKGSGYAEGG